MVENMSSDTSVVDNSEDSRFELWENDTLVGHVEHSVSDGVMALTHTEVDSEHGGKGYGGKLAAGALDAVREAGLKVDPVCPFIAGYIEKNPEYADLVVSAS